jgi:hypothetical protein
MLEQKMVERCFNKANECEQKGDLEGKTKWLDLALLAEQHYLKKEKKD